MRAHLTGGILQPARVAHAAAPYALPREPRHCVALLLLCGVCAVYPSCIPARAALSPGTALAHRGVNHFESTRVVDLGFRVARTL